MDSESDQYTFDASSVDGHTITIVRHNDTGVPDKCQDQLNLNALQTLLNPLPRIARNKEGIIQSEHDEEYYFGLQRFEVEIVRDQDYYVNMVQFEANDVLYNVPRGHWPFPISSEPSDLQNDETDVNLQSISCQGIDRTDIETILALTEYLHRSGFSDCPMPFSAEDCIRILRCATIWGLEDYRLRAIRRLEGVTEFTPLDRLDMARKYRIERWACTVFQGYADVRQALDENILTTLGLAVSTRIVRLREEKWTLGEGKKKKKKGQANNATNSSGGTKNPWWNRKTTQELAAVSQTSANAAVETILQILNEQGHDRSGDPVNKILLAKEVGVTDWLQSSLVEFIQRTAFPSQQDIESLDISRECLLHICEAREKHRTCPSQESEYTTRALEKFIAEAGITPVKLDLVERLRYARKRGYVGWLKEACSQLVTRKEAITFEEASRLSMEEYCAVIRGREAYRRQVCGELKLSETLTPEEATQIAGWAKEDVQCTRMYNAPNLVVSNQASDDSV